MPNEAYVIPDDVQPNELVVAWSNGKTLLIVSGVETAEQAADALNALAVSYRHLGG